MKEEEEGKKGGCSRSLRIKQVSSCLQRFHQAEQARLAMEAEKAEAEGQSQKEEEEEEREEKEDKELVGVLNMVTKLNIPQPDDEVFGQEAATALKKKVGFISPFFQSINF